MGIGAWSHLANELDTIMLFGNKRVDRQRLFSFTGSVNREILHNDTLSLLVVYAFFLCVHRSRKLYSLYLSQIEFRLNKHNWNEDSGRISTCSAATVLSYK